jgi:hypothetical protein
MAAAWDQAAGPIIVALHRSLGKLGQQGSNLNVLLNNVLNILTVNLGPEGSPRHALQRAKGPKLERRWTHDFALGPKPSWGIFGGDSWTLDSRALASVNSDRAAACQPECQSNARAPGFPSPRTPVQVRDTLRPTGRLRLALCGVYD